MSDLAWKDRDGDRVVISDSRDAIGDEPVLGSIEITDADTGRESAVYIDEQDARQLVAWLTERLNRV